METTKNTFIRKPEYKVPANEKKNYVAKFIKMLVEKKEDITEYMGKPLNWFNYDAIYTAVNEWEGQLRLTLDETVKENTKATEQLINEAKKKG